MGRPVASSHFIALSPGHQDGLRHATVTCAEAEVSETERARSDASFSSSATRCGRWYPGLADLHYPEIPFTESRGPDPSLQAVAVVAFRVAGSE